MRLITIEPVLLVYVFTAALLSPLLQQYIYDELSDKYNFTKSEEGTLCKNKTNADKNITKLENLVQTKASHWFLGLSLCQCVPSVLTTFLFGSLSDVVGRKPMLVLALIGGTLNNLITAITVTLGLPFYTTFLGSFVEGVTGSFAAVAGSCMAFIVDITDTKSRSIRLGVLEGMTLLGATSSFLLGGVWLKLSGYAVPCWVAAGLLFISGLYAIFFLPESLKEKQGFAKVSCMANLEKIKNFINAKRDRHVKTCLVLLFISFLFAVFDYFGSVTVAYTKHDPLCWNSEIIGYYMAAKIATAGLGIVFGFKILARIFSETMLVIIGCVFYIVSNVTVGFANTTAAMFLSCIPAFLAVIAPPCIRSIASKMVEQHEEGTLCSILAVTEAVAQLLAPIILNSLYPIGLTELHVKGFAFFVQAGILLIPIVLFSVIHYLTHKNKDILYGVLKDIDDTVQA